MQEPASLIIHNPFLQFLTPAQTSRALTLTVCLLPAGAALAEQCHLNLGPGQTLQAWIL